MNTKTELSDEEIFYNIVKKKTNDCQGNVTQWLGTDSASQGG